MIGKKHLFDTEMGQTSILPETINTTRSMEGIVGDNELDTQTDTEMISVPDTSNSDFNPPPILEHSPGISLRVPSPYTTDSINDSQANATREASSLTEAPSPIKTRKRKPKTKEISPDNTDHLHLINLGMSPFMPAQDAMTNQNRLVRNETILARHVFRIQKAQTASDSTHAQRVQDVYRVLADHKVLIESLKLQTGISSLSRPTPSAAGASTSMPAIRSDPDFMELLEEQRETRKILDELNDEMARFSAFTRRMIDGLTEAVQRLNATTQHAATSTSEPSYPPLAPLSSRPYTSRSIASSSSSSVVSTSSSNNDASSTSSLVNVNSNRTLPSISTLNLKRPGTDSINSSISSSLYSGGGNPNTSGGGNHNTHYPQINLIPTHELNPSAMSGSLSNLNVYHGDPNINDNRDEPFQNVDLSSSMVQSANGARPRPDHAHADARFWKVRR